MKFWLICVLAVSTTTAFDLRGDELKPRNIVAPMIEIEGRIKNGVDAPPDEVPYVVSLEIETSSNYHFCGGSVINYSYVVTAARCVDGVRNVTISAGSTKLRNAKVVVTIGKEKIHTHKWYNPITLSNDIALLEMPSTFTDWIQPVKLPARSKDYPTYAGVKAISCGWGRTSDESGLSPTLQCADFVIIKNSKCRRDFPFSITGSKICTLPPNGVSTWHGESGDPLIEASTKELIGIASYGKKGHAAVYTRVTSFLDWIDANTKD